MSQLNFPIVVANTDKIIYRSLNNIISSIIHLFLFNSNYV